MTCTIQRDNNSFDSSDSCSSFIDDENSSMDTSFDDSFSGVSDTPSSGFKNYDCPICSVKSRGITEHLKHLSKVHFKHKLLSCVPKNAPYRCPWNECEVVKKDRFNLALHYGVAHKVALALLQQMPEDAVNEDMEATCKLCHQSFTAHRYLYTHLSDTHYCSELDSDLPKTGPWKCPKCSYVGSDPRALRIHYGVRHKVVLDHLAKSLGMNQISLKKEMKAGRKKVVTALKTSVSCTYCSSEFDDLNELLKHNVLHFRAALSAHLPNQPPFSCPKCNHLSSEHLTLLLHYGTSHPEVLKDFSVQKVEALEDTDVDPDATNEMPQFDGSHVSSPSSSFMLPGQRQIEDDKTFPKCRICNYRYFTRLDLCRHFVDFHLRRRISSCINPNSTQCPSCSQTYSQPQSRLRHFIWSHQDLERLVMQDFNVRLSEFMPSSRDLEIVKKKCERRSGEEASADEDDDVTDLTDLAALPVHDKIDLTLNVSRLV